MGDYVYFFAACLVYDFLYSFRDFRGAFCYSECGLLFAVVYCCAVLFEFFRYSSPVVEKANISKEHSVNKNYRVFCFADFICGSCIVAFFSVFFRFYVKTNQPDYFYKHKYMRYRSHSAASGTETCSDEARLGNRRVSDSFGSELVCKTPRTAENTAEDLNVIIASLPIEDKDAEQRVKLNVLGMLNEAYGITERDFTRAEIEVVPAYKARDIGLDRAMIGAYGHDDRVDAYPALMAEIGTKSPAYTSVCVLTDKEETGSDGVTGLNSMYTFHFLQQLCAGQGADYITACKAAKCLSADVTAAYDPTFADAFEPDNGTYAGRGVAIYKYTGSRGKSGTSDASAELVSYLTGLMDTNSVVWQIGEMGKLDLGGGGTVAKYVANQDIDTIDIGVPVLSMHSPFEIVSKADVYMAYLTFKAFCEDAE